MPGPIDAPVNQTFTLDHDVRPDGSVHFACSQDTETWRWLELPPGHPIAVQVMNYWITVECSAVRGTFDPKKWSALVWADWERPDPEAGHPVRGVFENTDVDGELGFAGTFFDAQGRISMRMRGRGVVFRTRNFEGWRGEAKAKLVSQTRSQEFGYASKQAVGAGPGEFAFLAPVEAAPTHVAEGLVTVENGMPPAHRYISGSGDHVNSAHIAEIGRQFLALYLGNPDVRIEHGEIHFNRYVEIGTPFRVELVAEAGNSAELALSQAGQECTRLSLAWC